MSQNKKKISFNMLRIAPFLLLLMFVGGWQVLSQVDIAMLPSVDDVCLVLYSDRINIIRGLEITLTEAIVGLLSGTLIALVLAFLMYRFEIIRVSLYPFMIASQCIPTIAIAPILVIWLGYGIMSKVVLITLCCFFPIAVGVLDGFKSADIEQINLLKTMNASKLQIFRYIVLPSAKMYFFAALKVSVSYAVLGAVIAEWLGGSDGLGIYMVRAKKSFALDKLFAAVFIVCIVTCAMIWIVSILERSRKRWLCLLMFVPLTIPAIFVHPAHTPGLTHIRVMLDYTPNTNHTGLYVAQELGFFAEEGINVEIVQPPQDGAAVLVNSGEVEFGVDFQDQLAALFDTLPSNRVKVLGAIMQHNTSLLLSPSDVNIRTFKDLKGKKYATFDNFIEMKMISYCMAKYGENFNSVKVIHTQDMDAESAFKSNIDAVWAYYGWDVINCNLRGIRTTNILFTDVDPVFDYYTPVVIGNADFMDENQELTRKFMRAVSSGYNYAIENPEKSARILLKCAPQLDEDLVVESQRWASQQYKKDVQKWGVIDECRWSRFYKWLYNEGLTNTDLSEQETFTNRYLP